MDDGEGQIRSPYASGEGWTRRLRSRDQETEDRPWTTHVGCMEEQEFTLVMGDEDVIDKSQGRGWTSKDEVSRTFRGPLG